MRILEDASRPVVEYELLSLPHCSSTHRSHRVGQCLSCISWRCPLQSTYPLLKSMSASHSSSASQVESIMCLLTVTSHGGSWPFRASATHWTPHLRLLSVWAWTSLRNLLKTSLLWVPSFSRDWLECRRFTAAGWLATFSIAAVVLLFLYQFVGSFRRRKASASEAELEASKTFWKQASDWILMLVFSGWS